MVGQKIYLRLLTAKKKDVMVNDACWTAQLMQVIYS